MSRYALPDLPYDFGALEPHIDGRIVELHHGKHHAAYVKAANEAIEQLMEVRDEAARGEMSPALAQRVASLEKKIAFNVSGHVLHSLYWQNMAPGAGGDPDGDLAQMIERDFGSFERLKKQMIGASMSIMGSGWAALVWDPLLKRLGTTQIHDHQSEITQGSVPLLVLDVWEHAYYLQYQADKAKYLEAIWNLWNWDDVAARLRNAQALDLALHDAATEPARVPAIGDDELHAPQHP